ncbi:hypothetical protein DFH06DRAFT_1138871 [Mycena polygramma]|nr:hypothetical protein DFH06DRAFT_1138871 [Mycena polygramma]
MSELLVGTKSAPNTPEPPQRKQPQAACIREAISTPPPRRVVEKSDILPAILSMLTNLETLRVRIYKWDYLQPKGEQAICALITRSSLSSIELEEARMSSSVRLLSFLRCLPASLESASFWNVFDYLWFGGHHDLESPSHQLRLVSLQLKSFAPVLFDWALKAVDLNCLRYLYTSVQEDTMAVVQQLIDSAVCVETYHLSFKSVFSFDESPNLEKMQRLRTLEISVILDWEEIQEVEGEGRHNPLNDAMRSLDTATHNVEHLILNLEMWNPDYLTYFTESYFPRFMSLCRLKDERPALLDVVMRIVSRNNHSVLQRGIKHLKAVFRGLNERGLLTVVAYCSVFAQAGIVGEYVEKRYRGLISKQAQIPPTLEGKRHALSSKFRETQDYLHHATTQPWDSKLETTDS